MGQTTIQPSFAAGELSPSLYSRVDLAKFHSGAALMRNLFVDYRGGATNRAGTAYVGQCLPGINRLIKFSFSTTQNYALLFSDHALRIIMDGGLVLEPSKNVTAATNANPVQLTASSLAFANGNLANGDWVFLTGLGGMTQVNGLVFIVQNVNLGAGTFTLTDLNGNAIDSTAYGVYTSGGTVARVATITSPYAASELALLKFAQSLDTMTLCSPAHPVYQLTRTQHYAWTFTQVTFTPTAGIPQGVVATNSNSGSTTYNYEVTAIVGSSESRPSNMASCTGATLSATPNTSNLVTWTPVSGAAYYNIYRTPEVGGGAPPAGSLFGFVGSATGSSFIDNNIAPNFSVAPPLGNNPFSGGASIQSVAVTAGGSGYGSITLSVNDPTGTGAVVTPTVVAGVITAVTVSNGGTNYTSPQIIVIGSGGGSGASIELTIDSSGVITAVTVVAGGSGYSNPTIRVRSLYGSGAVLTPTVVAGVITAVVVTNGGTDYFSNGPDGPSVPTPIITDHGSGSGATFSVTLSASSNNPLSVCYFQQRQMFGGTANLPDTLFASKTGDYLNMDYSNPSQADDSIQVNILSTQVNAIKHLVPINSLVVLTSSGAWRVDGGTQSDSITPTAIEAVPQAYNGCSDVPPLVINYDILYVQNKQSIVRDLSYNFYVNIYTGADMSVLSNHLFDGRTITEWAYAEEPHKIVWCVRDDGIALSFTFLKEQEVYGWARHDTQGLFKSVCSITEGEEDAVYFCIQRTINGNVVQYVERLNSRLLGGDVPLGIPGDITKAWFVDAGLTYPLTYPNANLTPVSQDYTPTLTGTQIINGGSGYTAPTLVINDPTGTGAVLTPTVTAGAITAVALTNPGTGYTNPTVAIVDPTGSGAVVSMVLQNLITMNADAAVFSGGNVGNTVQINQGIGTVVSVPTTQRIVVNINTSIPLRSGLSAASGEWSCTAPTTTVTGLNHLEGMQVSVLADGNVQSNKTVTNGAITLSRAATFIKAGLGYTCQLKTLYLSTGAEPTDQTKRKHINQATIRVKDSRGAKWGVVDFNTNLVSFKERGSIGYNNVAMGQCIPLITGDELLNLAGNYTMNAQILIQQDDPLPLEVLGLINEVTIGDTSR